MEPFIHFILPLIFLLAFGKGYCRKKILLYSPLAVLPDIDFFFGHALFHNIFMPFILASIFYHLSGKDRQVWTLSMYFLLSHLILDLGFVALFYPFGGSVFSLNVNIYTSPTVWKNIVSVVSGEAELAAETGNILHSTYAVDILPLEEAAKSPISPVFTQTSLIIALLLVLTFVVGRQLKVKHGD